MNRAWLYAFAILSGLAALSWEVLWQLKATLALGVSALGTAITLATTMGGMSLGSILTNFLLVRRQRINPLRVYAGLELVIGISGLLLSQGFALLERWDAAFFRLSPAAAPWLNGLGIACLLGVPSLAMGATVPVYGLLGRNYRAPLAALYGLNTAGAAVGCLLLAFAAVPQFGVETSISLVAFGNLLLCLMAGALAGKDNMLLNRQSDVELPLPGWEQGVALLTGFATFSLEIAWFRCLRGAFSATTGSFSIMLTAVLVGLALGARLARRKLPIGPVLCAAGVAILLATPLVERFDTWERELPYWETLARRLGRCLLVLGPPMLLLGTALPTLLERRQSLKLWARLYALNTLGAIVGALFSAWILLPALGFVKTAWLIGLLTGGAGLGLTTRRVPAAAALGAAGLVAFFTSTGIGTLRMPTLTPLEGKIVRFYEGPDCQTVVWELPDGTRHLFIDGFSAAMEGKASHYMAWMGRVPMLLHPDPRQALVICFGTGQTINGVRQEGVESADVVDVNPRVLESAPLFAVNQRVLEDPRIHPVVMDGRAWLRRTDHTYDVITLEPMPPTFAGVNALYSLEFYRLVAARLNPGGIAAQWLPLHLQRPQTSISIAATFQAVFGDSMVWTDPNGDCLLVGRLSQEGLPLGQEWPGLARTAPGRDMTDDEIRQACWMNQDALAYYTTLGDGRLVTDDNQLLAYGESQKHFGDDGKLSLYLMQLAFNVKILQRAGELAQEPLAGQLESLRGQLESGKPPLAWPAVREGLAQLPPGPLHDLLKQLRF